MSLQVHVLRPVSRCQLVGAAWLLPGKQDRVTMFGVAAGKLASNMQFHMKFLPVNRLLILDGGATEKQEEEQLSTWGSTFPPSRHRHHPAGWSWPRPSAILTPPHSRPLPTGCVYHRRFSRQEHLVFLCKWLWGLLELNRGLVAKLI